MIGTKLPGGASRTARATLGRLTADPVDLLVIGGGILGAGVARDAAMRGLSVALVEQNDLGSGTSSRSSRLIHGGLRYLEQGNFGLVFEAVRERGILLRTAPHLVWPLPFVFPVHRGARVPLWRLALGMLLYDALALFGNVRRHRMLRKDDVLQVEPMVRERGLVGGARYYDAQCDDARLVVATVRSAMVHGALVGSYMAVRGLEVENGRVVGARVEDRLGGGEGVVRASVVVNATGPWSDRVRALEEPGVPPMLRTTKGVHVAVPRERLGLQGAVTFTSRVDGRVMFALPWGDLAYLGTTDTDTVESPDALSVTSDDVVYLLRSANAHFPGAHLTADDVRAEWAGLRPLLAESGYRSASRVSREHSITQGPGGMLTVAGGKLTTYRSIAAQVVNRVRAELGRRNGQTVPREARTDLEPLVGGEAFDLNAFRERGLEMGLAHRTVDHLLRHYGTESAGIYNLGVADRGLLRRLHPDHPAIEAEVIHAVSRELAQRVEDVLVRRIHLYYETPDRGARAARRVAELMGGILGWDADRVTAESERYVRDTIPPGERRPDTPGSSLQDGDFR